MQSVHLVVAIDEDPSRYTRLVAPLARAGLALVQSSQPTILEHLFASDSVAAVLLDYDLPDHKGTYYARRFLLERDIPVLVTSGNPQGADELVALLEEHGVKHGQISARRGSAVADWTDWVLAEGVK